MTLETPPPQPNASEGTGSGASEVNASALRVLFLCTGNSARSILGEALLRHHGGPRFDTASAGARPTGQVHPGSLRVLREEYGIDAADAHSKSVDELGPWQPDLVITVCSDAAESCPTWPGDTAVAHWGLPDPASVDDPADQLKVFRYVAEVLDRRIQRLVALETLESLSRDERAAAVNDFVQFQLASSSPPTDG